ncbi:hypothetical protein [Mycoplasmopsis arginini]
MKLCEQCKNVFDENTTFCNKCGSKLIYVENKTQENYQQQKIYVK